MSKSNQGNAEMMEIRGDEDALICRLGWCDDRAKIYTKNGHIDWESFCEQVNRAQQAHRGRRGKKRKIA